MKNIVVLFYLVVSVPAVMAQDFILLWPEGKMPNSKGIKPGMWVFTPSAQENKNAAVIICPGGGYKHYAYAISGIQIAKWFNTMGVTAFVLNARFPHSPDLIERHSAPLQDAQRAIRIIRRDAARWGINTKKIGIIGFSAGGHLAATLGTHTKDVSKISDALDTVSFRPDFMMLVSPVISMGMYTHEGSRDNLLGNKPPADLVTLYSNEFQVTDKTPPTFLVHADDDRTVDTRNSVLFYNALRDKKIPASLHIFPFGGHNIALRNNPGTANSWPSLGEQWLIEMGIIKGANH
jgi:acetyl esterase/lipase